MTLPEPRRQRGVALITALMILIVLTLIGVTAMSTANLEEKMAGNMRDLNLAFQASESCLRDGEDWLDDLTSRPIPDNLASNGVYSQGTAALAGLENQTAAWWAANGTQHGANTGSAPLDKVATQPSYVLEHLKFDRDTFDVGLENPTGRDFYRVTSRGTGGSDASLSVLQTTFIRRFN